MPETVFLKPVRLRWDVPPRFVPRVDVKGTSGGARWGVDGAQAFITHANALEPARRAFERSHSVGRALLGGGGLCACLGGEPLAHLCRVVAEMTPDVACRRTVFSVSPGVEFWSGC